ncbi:MAG: scyllo-inositol 2-dehydrogenase [Actinomycetota bacterium]|nr:scyllo-inositol 2-dehydrogenase [Actinomycetota bacterium]
MSDETLQVAVVGFGLAGSVFHAPLVAATPGMAVSAVVTSNAERAAKARASYDGVTVFADVDELFAKASDVDLVVVATPNRDHAPIALRAVAAGIPVVVDKPFAVTAAEGQSVIDAAAAAGVPLTVFQNRRWDGDFLTLRRLLDEGVLGTVSRFESRFERWRPVPTGGWRETGSIDDASGLLFDLGAHLIDQALLLFGSVTAVYAEVDSRRPTVAADDDVFVGLTHASGVRSHLWASAVTPQLGPRFRVLGSRSGYVKYGLDVQEEALRAGRRPDSDDDWGSEDEASWGSLGVAGESSPVATEPGSYQAFYEAVTAALRGRGELPVDAADSVEGLRIIEAARRSSEEARPVAR